MTRMVQMDIGSTRVARVREFQRKEEMGTLTEATRRLLDIALEAEGIPRPEAKPEEVDLQKLGLI